MCENEGSFAIEETTGWRPELNPALGDRAQQHRDVLAGAMEDAGVTVVVIQTSEDPVS